MSSLLCRHETESIASAIKRADRSGWLLTRSGAAEMLAVSVSTLERWERRGYGPKPVRFDDRRSRSVRYRADDVMEFIRKLGKQQT